MSRKKKASLITHLPSGETLLTAATEAGNIEALEMFLKTGADINGVNKTGSSALHIAAVKGHQVILQILLQHNAEDLVDRLGMTALHLACLHGNLEIVQLLLNHGCCPNGSRHPQVSSPLMMALGTHNDVVLLLMQFGADMNKRQSWGNNAFSRAVAMGDVALVKAMLSLAEPDLSHVNDSVYNIFHCIFRFKHFLPDNDKANHCEMLALITSYINKNQNCIEDFKKSLTEAMPLCVRSGCLTCFKMALPYIDIHHKYTKNGTDLLQHAMSSDYPWSSTGPSWTYRSTSGYGLDACHKEMVQLLLDQGASLLATKHNVIGQLYGAILSQTSGILDMYIVFIRAWGGWYPDQPESTTLFRKFVLKGDMDVAARLLCWAGFNPSDHDLEVLHHTRKKKQENPTEEFKNTFTTNPRPLLNSAVVVIRRCLCDNVSYKMKSLMLPKTLEDHITLKSIVDYL